MIKVKFHCNYCSDFEIYNKVLTMTKNNLGVWKNIKVVLEDYDIFVIMNYPLHNNYKPQNTIVFESETPTTRNNFPKFYDYNKSEYLYVYDTKNKHNVDLWYHGLKYDELFYENLYNKSNQFSIINSNLNNLPGHILRNKFINYLTDKIEFDLYGRSYQNNKNYKGSLNKKCDGLNSYKYTFNCENDFENNYFTEKILDGIFCECLTFYYGCPNIKDFIDDRCFVQLDLNDFEYSLKMIKDFIKYDLFKDRLIYIREEKQRIVNDLNVLNIINNILEKV